MEHRIHLNRGFASGILIHVQSSRKSVTVYRTKSDKIIEMYLKIHNIFTRPNEFLPDMSGGQTAFREDCMFHQKKKFQDITYQLPLCNGFDGKQNFVLRNKSTVKILKVGTPQTIAIIVLKLVKFDVTLH